jgi:DNA-binding NtrC family response regulator
MATVLVVDDEPVIRFNIAEFLRAKDYQVDEARDGKTAIDLIDVKNFDAVISDHRMPGTVSGVDVLTLFHQRDPDKVKVLITAYGDATVQKQVDAIGGLLIPKPFLFGDLLRALNRQSIR